MTIELSSGVIELYKKNGVIKYINGQLMSQEGDIILVEETAKKRDEKDDSQLLQM